MAFAALQRHLAKWIVEVADRRIHGTTSEQPIIRFERDERQALRPLPARPLAIRTRRLPRRVSADCFVDVDTIRYSVPHRHVREYVEVVVGTDRVEVRLRGARIAGHARSFEPGTWVRDPAHFEGLYRPETMPRRRRPGRRGATEPGVVPALGLHGDRGRGPAMSMDLDPVEERVIGALKRSN